MTADNDSTGTPPEPDQPWQRLRRDLRRLMGQTPSPLQMFADPAGEHRDRPVEIHLAPYAEQVAADLYAAYGDFVSLYVGRLPYPPAPEFPALPQPSALPTADPSEIGVALDGPLTVRSGHTVTHRLLLTNRSADPLQVHTNGHLTAQVVDPATGEVVGGFTGAQHLPLIVFTAEPGATVTIPLLVGTASFDPRRGYRIPAGEWRLRSELHLGERRPRRTPPLTFTVTD